MRKERNPENLSESDKKAVKMIYGKEFPCTYDLYGN